MENEDVTTLLNDIFKELNCYRDTEFVDIYLGKREKKVFQFEHPLSDDEYGHGKHLFSFGYFNSDTPTQIQSLGIGKIICNDWYVDVFPIKDRMVGACGPKSSSTTKELIKNGVITEDLMALSAEDVAWDVNLPPYRFTVKINVNKLKEWIKQEKSKHISKMNQYIIIPDGKDHLYENGVLHIRLQNNTNDVVDLSNSPKVKPIFESIYNLYKNSVGPFFSKEDLLTEYEKNTHDEIDWQRFVEGVSDIKKRINNKKALRKRVTLKYNNKKQCYEFAILPLSSSDK